MSQNLIAARCSTFIVEPVCQKYDSNTIMTSYNENNATNVVVSICGISTFNRMDVFCKLHELDFSKHKHLGGKNWIFGPLTP